MPSILPMEERMDPGDCDSNTGPNLTGILPGMATRSVAPRQPSRRVWVAPTPVKRKRFRWLRRLLFFLLFLLLALAVASAYLLSVYAPGLKSEARTVPGLVQDQLALHGATYVPIEGISPDLQHAIVSIEDRRFYHHPGVDPLGIVRAFWVNLTQKHVDQGGSTLEQQLVKRT